MPLGRWRPPSEEFLRELQHRAALAGEVTNCSPEARLADAARYASRPVTAHAISLARIHPEVVRRAEESRPAGQIPDLSAVLGWLANDDRLVAETVINLLTMLHEGMIGVPGGNGLCEAFRAAAAQFDAT